MPYRANKTMQSAARTALDYNKSAPYSQRWGTSVGRRRAKKIAEGGEFNKAEISQIFAFLKRFEKDYTTQRNAKKYGKAYYAYMGWGGPDALTWAKDKLERYERAGE